MSEPTIAQIIDAYLNCRRRKEELDREYKDKVKPIKDRMEKAENWLLERMLAADVKNMAAAGGTAYIKERVSCTVEDWEAFLQHIKGDAEWDMLNHSANKTAVSEYIAKHGEVPPGIKWRSENVVQVRVNSK